ncbi:MAG: aminotransferase class V-fold PLP-dependent enzyme, partial [Elusimicrobiota bacterium]
PARIRGDFPLLARTLRGKPLVYLDNAATTQKPRAVLDALMDFYEKHNANVNRGVHTLSEEATALMEESREKTARLIHAPKPHTVIFTRNTTESINLVARAWGDKNLKKGEEILLTELEHHSNLVPWQMLCQRTGALLRSVPMEADGTLSAAKARKLLSPKTRLFSFTAASNALGSLSPVKELVGLAHRVGALALVDAAQWTPHRATDVGELDCDFLAFSAHKMLGPTGVGVLWGKEELLESMDPFLGGGDMISQVWPERFTCNALPHKFEAGTPNVADIAAFGAAVDYLQSLGFEALRGEADRQL